METDEVEDHICYHCQEERSWWRVWAAVAVTIAILTFGAMMVYRTGFAAGVNAAQAADRGGDGHKASGCEQESCPPRLFLQEPVEPERIAL